MKVKFIRNTLLALVLALPLVAMRDTGEKEIRWHSKLRLSWADFKGRPDRLSGMDALTESGISFSWWCNGRQFHSEIYALFVPEGSWVKDPTPHLLQHEQAHFDITEIHARKMRKYFGSLKDPCAMGKFAIDRASKEIVNTSYAMQERYDEETSHSRNKRKQAEWLAYIQQELAALEEWAE